MPEKEGKPIYIPFHQLLFPWNCMTPVAVRLESGILWRGMGGMGAKTDIFSLISKIKLTKLERERERKTKDKQKK